MIFSGMTNSYKGYVDSKRAYLKRKKQLNRGLRSVKKRQRLCKPHGRRYCQMIINKGVDDLYLLNLMYKYHKRENKMKKKVR